MQMKRRDFIAGAASLFGWGIACGPGAAFAAEPGTFSRGTPNLVFGILSDIHVRLVRKKGKADKYEGLAMFRKALEWFRDHGVDAVTVSGDIADHGLVEEFKAVAGAWNAVFPGGKAPDGRHVEKLFVYGNHDWEGFKYGANAKKTFGKNFMKHALRGDYAGNWDKIMEEPYSPVWRKEIKGYTFVGAHWVAGKCRGREETGVPQVPEWYRENARTIDPSKPFFHLQHPPPKNTAHGPWLWGHDDGSLTKTLSAFPNAFSLTGHSHAPINSDRAIWQGAFTAIDVGSLKYTGLHYGGIPAIGRENDINEPSAMKENSYRVMNRINTQDGHQGMIAKVFDDRIVFERWDFEDLSPLGPDWVVPLPKKDPPAFAFEPRAKASVAPEFPSGAALSARMTTGKNRGGKNVQSREQPVLELTIPAANGKSGGRVFDYAIELAGADGRKETRYVLHEGCHRSPGSKRANAPTVCRLAPRRLAVSGEVEIRVSPRNSFGKEGAAISTTFTLPS